VVGTDAMNCLR